MSSSPDEDQEYQSLSPQSPLDISNLFSSNDQPSDLLPVLLPTMNKEEAGPSVSAVGVKLPEFWSKDPELWFIQVEHQFKLANVTADSTKLSHIVSKISCEVLQHVKDILKTPPTDGTAYQTFKDRLLKKYSETKEQKMNDLLSGMELGDMKPSELLTKMKDKVDDATKLETVIKQLWLKQLPTQEQAILLSLDTLDLEKLAETADRIHAMPGPSVSAVSSKNTNLEELENRLVQRMEELMAVERSRSRYGNRESQNYSRGRGSNRGSYRGNRNGRSQSREFRTHDDKGVCWRHSRYGDEAHSCVKPCTYRNSKN
jgi:hypothetical protein